MILKIIFFLLILRAGLVNAYYNDNSTVSTVSTVDYNDNRVSLQVDKCAEFGVIKHCTSGKPYCFVDGDNIGCGRTQKIGWRISPLDGLVLNNGQIPNPHCTLFIPPEKPDTIELIERLLRDSVYGSTFGYNESAWFNMFEYLGNCPWKSQFCDKDTLTCQDLFDTGKNCNSSNQCFSHHCKKYGNNETDRRCASGSDESDRSDGNNNTKKSTEPIGLKNGLNDEQVKMLSIVITVSVCSAMIIPGMAVYLMLKRKLKRKRRPSLNKSNRTISSFFPSYMTNYSNNSQSDGVLSRMSTRSRSSRYAKRHTSDHFSVLLPPLPTLSRDSSLRVHPYRSGNNRQSFDSNDSFDIYPPPQQYQHENSFNITY